MTAAVTVPRAQRLDGTDDIVLDPYWVGGCAYHPVAALAVLYPRL